MRILGIPVLAVFITTAFGASEGHFWLLKTDLGTTSSTTLSGDTWHWHHHWSRGDESTVLLTKFSSVPEGKGNAAINHSALQLNCEIVSVKNTDLERF